MAKKVTLAVNNVPINLDLFVSGYVESVVGVIVASRAERGIGGRTPEIWSTVANVRR